MRTSTKVVALFITLFLLGSAFFISIPPVTKAAAEVSTSTPVSTAYLSGLVADTSRQTSLAKKNLKSAAKSKSAYDKTVNSLGPFFTHVLVKKSSVLKKLKTGYTRSINAKVTGYPLLTSTETTYVAIQQLTFLQQANVSARKVARNAGLEAAFYKNSKSAIDKAFSNDGHASLTSYNDGTRAFGDVARAPQYRGTYILLPGIGFFYASDVGGAVHGRARADVYTPWAAEPCNDALAIFGAGGPPMYEFNMKKLGICMSSSAFKSQKRHYEQPSAIRASHSKYGVYSK